MLGGDCGGINEQNRHCCALNLDLTPRESQGKGMGWSFGEALGQEGICFRVSILGRQAGNTVSPMKQDSCSSYVLDLLGLDLSWTSWPQNWGIACSADQAAVGSNLPWQRTLKQMPDIPLLLPDLFSPLLAPEEPLVRPAVTSF